MNLIKNIFKNTFNSIKTFDYKNSFNSAIEKRFGFRVEDLKIVLNKFLNKPLPQHFSYFNLFGAIIIILFIILGITGIALSIYYKPTPDEAHTSIKYIMNEVPYGWLIRSIHSWSSKMLFVFLFIHFWKAFFTGAYKFPRELTWFIGLFLMGILILFGFTGSLLPWNNNSYWSASIMTSELKDAPLFGRYLSLLIRGGEDVGSGTLTRFYVSHITILPVAFAIFFLMHIMLIIKQGLSEWKKEKVQSQSYNFSILSIDISILTFGLFALLVCFSVFIPAELGEVADPLRMPQKIIPEWFLLPLYNLYRIISEKLLFLNRMDIFFILFVCISLLLLFLPFIDKSEERHPVQRPFATITGLIVIAMILFLLFMRVD